MDETLQDTSNHPRQAGLQALNVRFHEEFARLRDEACRAIARGEHPVFVRMDDRLLLVNGEERLCADITGEHDHVLKAIAHVPLAGDAARAALDRHFSRD